MRQATLSDMTMRLDGETEIYLHQTEDEKARLQHEHEGDTVGDRLASSPYFSDDVLLIETPHRWKENHGQLQILLPPNCGWRALISQYKNLMEVKNDENKNG